MHSKTKFSREKSRKKRADILERAAARELDLLLATSLADEGLDLPILSKVFLTYPSRARARITQRLGRLMRPHPLKGKAVLYDFVDRVGVLKAQARQRQCLYRKILGAK